MTFIQNAVAEHTASGMYQTAVAAGQYFAGENPTIARYEKILYDAKGIAHQDRWSANHKIMTGFYYFAITQEVQYLLGNGIIFGNDSTAKKLSGKSKKHDISARLKDLAVKALNGGVAFGFFNLDHVDAFSVTEFAPLYDAENGALMAGVRFWVSADEKTTRMTLYEIDGYTDYIKRGGNAMQVMQPKRAYKIKAIGDKKDIEDGTAIYHGENYPGFPIIPLWGNDKHKSELAGRRGTLDAYDLLNSNLVNNVDEANLIYWTIANCGGMDSLDDQKFMEQLRTLHVAHVDGDSGGANIEAHTVEAPVNASATAIETIRQRLFDDFMALDVSSVSAGNKTATEIVASYQQLDGKTDAFEYCVLDFMNALLALAGIDDTVSFSRSKVVNKSDEINTILAAAEYLDEDTVTTLICNTLGIADQAQDIIEKRKNEELSRFAAKEEIEDDNIAE